MAGKSTITKWGRFQKIETLWRHCFRGLGS
jgi:hypothetical protein